MKWSERRSVVSNCLWPHGLCSPQISPGQNTGVGSLSLLQWIFPTYGSNPGLPYCRWILYYLSPQGKHVKNSKREGARDLASVGSRKWEVLSVYTSLWKAKGPDSLKSGAGSSALTLEIRMLGLLKTHPLRAAPSTPRGITQSQASF